MDKTINRLYNDFSHMREINRENLKKIIHDNRDTAFGRKYGFGGILSGDEYRAAVPLTTYDDYEPFLGKENGHTAYPIKTILTTSGTTSGKQKEFPLTYEGLARDSSFVFYMPYYLTGEKRGPHLHISVFRPPQNGKTLISAAYYNYILEEGFLDTDMYLGGKELMYSDTIQDVAYLKAYLALSCRELVSFHSIFLYDILALMGYIEQNWRTLVADMRAGTISGRLDFDTKERLLCFRPDSERIDELEAALSRGFDRDTVRRIWKNLKFAVGIGGGIYLFQELELRRYLGDLPVYYTIFASSECMMGISIKMNSAEYAMFPRNAYYEFIDEEGLVITLDEVEAGGVYELVLTTFSGLYRYRMGDKIRVRSFEGESPVFVAVGRTNNILNIAGEKLDETVAKEVVCELIHELGIHVYDFALGIDISVIPNRYCLFVECDGAKVDVIADMLDAKLKKACPDYEDVRALHMLHKPIVRTLKRGEIRAMFDKTKKGQAHDKPKTFLSVAQTEALIASSREGNP